jgi:hypothetical protein
MGVKRCRPKRMDDAVLVARRSQGSGPGGGHHRKARRGLRTKFPLPMLSL